MGVTFDFYVFLPSGDVKITIGTGHLYPFIVDLLYPLKIVISPLVIEHDKLGNPLEMEVSGWENQWWIFQHAMFDYWRGCQNDYWK